MDSVSKMLENIIAVEASENLEEAVQSDHLDDHEHREEAKLPDTEKLRAHQAENFAQTASISDFWYLEDDQKKVSNQLTDRILEKVLNVIIDTEVEASPVLDLRMIVHKDRPPLSVSLMSINSTQMAQKASPIFEIIDFVLYFAGWYNPYFTIGATLILTLLVLNPYLISALPSFLLINRLMIPSYAKLYPLDPSLLSCTDFGHNPFLHTGPPLRKYEPPKPVSQFSRDFIMNFTDLQNYLVPYIRLYDALLLWGQHYFLFEDLQLSSMVFMLLLLNGILSMTTLPYVIPFLWRHFPLKCMSLVSIWTLVFSLHPKFKAKLLDFFDTEEARLARLDSTDRVETMLMNLMANETAAKELTKEVEVFELHFLNSDRQWELVGFTSNFYTHNHPQRHLNELVKNHESDQDATSHTELDTTDLDEASSPKSPTKEEHEGMAFNIPKVSHISDVKPPKYWKYAEAKWQIDLEPNGWVDSNYVMDLVIVDTDEKWVYDYVESEIPTDGQVFRRRRWVRQCERDGEKDIKDSSIAAADRLSKTFTTLLL